MSKLSSSPHYLTAEKLGAHLMSKGWHVTAAESCTGGGLAKAFTEVPGSSEWFEGSVVTYSNEVKTRELGVPENLIAKNGAVSEEVAAAMCNGVLTRFGADLGVAISGIAGPGGGSAEKPVGTVCFAWGRPDKISTQTVIFDGNRSAVRRQAVDFALQQLLACTEEPLYK